MNTDFVIQEKGIIQIENHQVQILLYLGQLTPSIHYFQVKISPESDSSAPGKLGLLRVGSTEGGLSRELKLREELKEYKMIGELLAHTTKESVVIDFRPPLQQEESDKNRQPILDAANNHQVHDLVAETDAANNHQANDSSAKPDESKNLDPDVVAGSEQSINDESLNSVADEAEKSPDESDTKYETPRDELDAAEEIIEAKSEYLDEECYPEKDMNSETGDECKLILLSYLPEESSTLEAWLAGDNSLESSLYLSSQVCQFFRYIYQKGWCVVHILPQLIQMGTPIAFFDLTGVYAIDEQMRSGLSGNYCAPELAIGTHPIHESMSSYAIGALLYQSIHKQPLPRDNKLDINIQPIPRIYQLLKISLSPIPEERFSLSQLLSLLVESRQSFPTKRIEWNVASRSTVGLSTSRLQNEDSYGIRQVQLSNSESLILGVVADGMGGMSQGEVASKLAVETTLEEPIPSEFKTVEQKSEWLLSLVQKANESVATNVRDGGTTLSIVLAVGRDLMIAHVGDSRIYLLRNKELQQLSEDHSLVAMLVASGEITYEESLDHPDRNVLTKSIGSKRRLSNGYVQDLSRSSEGLSMLLEDGDILLLCSDGVWDLVDKDELAGIFAQESILQTAVDETIDRVLKGGAPDNATLLALQLHCNPENSY
jgi:serine/threonine protein phosphatase PrpC